MFVYLIAVFVFCDGWMDEASNQIKSKTFSDAIKIGVSLCRMRWAI